MSKLRIILRDFYRFHFKRNKKYNIKNISFWKIKYYSLEHRESSILKLEKWINLNNHLNSINSQKNNLTYKYEQNLFLEEYYEFNSKKKIREQNGTFEVSILKYSFFSRKLLNEYKKSKNIQFLNTSLKINDFIIYCQIKSNDKAINGSISSYFPCYYKSFEVDYFANELILKNLQKELFFIKEIKNEKNI